MKTNTNQTKAIKEVGTIYGCGHRVGTPCIQTVKCYRFDVETRKTVFTHDEQREDWRHWVGQCPTCYDAAMKRIEEQRKAENGCYDWIGSDVCF